MDEAIGELEQLIQKLESSAGRNREVLQRSVTKLTQEILGHIKEITQRW
jgi:DNA anti-recombination protein RmuC